MQGTCSRMQRQFGRMAFMLNYDDIRQQIECLLDMLAELEPVPPGAWTARQFRTQPWKW